MTRPCAVCGNDLPAGARSDRAYCSATCRKAAAATRHRASATMKGGHARPRRAKPRTAISPGGDWTAARDDLAVFAALVGVPLTPQQAALGNLDRRITVVIAPRQTGKTRTLAMLGTWEAFRRPGILVLIVSASDDAARRVLSMVKDTVNRPPLSGSVVDDLASLVRLTNGSVIRSVPASERAIRGWSADLLLVDEASLVSDDVLLGAALPTTTARPDARIILAGTPWAMAGAMYGFAQAGDTAYVRVLGWSLEDAPWIGAAVIENARATMPDARFRAEMQAEWVGDDSAYFDPALILASVADYAMTPPAEVTNGGSVVTGCDWGRAFDYSAATCLGVVDDGDANGHPVLFIPWIEGPTRKPYADQVAAVAAIGRPMPRPTTTWRGWGSEDRAVQAMGTSGMTLYQDVGTYVDVQVLRAAEAARGYHVVRFVSEMNGVGDSVTADLARLVGSSAVQGVYTSQRNKESSLGRIRAWMSDGRLVLPASSPDLLRQLRGLSVHPTPTGALSIAASNPAIHDDLADSLMLAAQAVPWDLSAGTTTDPGPVEWVHTASGVAIPRLPHPRQAALADLRRSIHTS